MVDRWTNPTTASLRGEDSRPLQQTFSSLSSYLEKLDNAITAAAASGVSSLSAGTGIGLSGGTGAVTVSNTGVTSLAGTANQITVSAGTGNITLSLPQNIHTGAVPTFGGLVSNGNVTVPVTSNSFFSDSSGFNFWRPVDTAGNSYFRLSSGSWFSDAANYYFRNASSSNVAIIDSIGNTTVAGQFRSNTSASAGGFVMRPWSANGQYVSFVTNSMSGADYIFLSDGLDTFVGSAINGKTHIRSSSNNTSSQVIVRPNNVDIGGTLNFGYAVSSAGNSSYIQFGPNSTWGSYLRVGSTPNVVANGIAQVISTNGNLHLDCGTGQDIYVNYYSGRPIRIHGFVEMNGQAISNAGYIQAGGTGITYNGSVSANNWFRSTTGTGWYNEAHAGGIWMYDNWVRIYNNKPFYCENEFRTGNVFSGNAGRSRGSYGAISIGGNGITNTWDGIEFASAQTFMIQSDNYSGVFRNNNAWNWLFNYSTLAIGSDERYKRDIQPLNAGLNFIENLNPISFLKLTENPNDEPEATESHYYYGFSAQNVRAALDAIGETRDVKIHDIGGPNMGLVACTEDAVYDRQYIGITEFIAPIVQAVKELSSRVKQLEEGAVAQ